jgi:hypothetical protein
MPRKNYAKPKPLKSGKPKPVKLAKPKPVKLAKPKPVKKKLGKPKPLKSGKSKKMKSSRRKRKSGRYRGACGKYIKQRDYFKSNYNKNKAIINDLTFKNNSLADFTNRCKLANNKLTKKNNLLLNTTKYLKDQLFGAIGSAQSFTIGYMRSFIDALNEKDDIINQKISQPIIKEKTIMTENFKSACSKYKKQRNNIQTKVNQQLKRIKQLNSNINNLNKLKYECVKKNSILIKKNNALLDTTQFFDNQLNDTNGYKNQLINIQNTKDDILNKTMAKAVTRENFDSIYDTVNTQNNIVENQIKMNEEKHSVDNQNYINLNNQIELLNSLNQITGWILFGVIMISMIIIWFSNKSLVNRLVMVKVVWLYVIIIEILEYVLFYAYIYIRSVFFGEQSTYKDYWKFPELSWMDIGILILIVLSPLI